MMRRKVAVVMMIHDEPLPGGELSDAINLAANLRAAHSTDLLMFTEAEPSKAWHSAFAAGLNVHRRAAMLRTLGRYDFLILTAAGNRYDRKSGGAWWREALGALRKPFAVKVCAEDHEKLFPHRDELFYHQSCAAVLPLEPDLYRPSNGLFPFQAKVLRFGAVDYARLHGRRAPKYEKRDVVVSTAMLARRKRVLELVESADEFAAAGVAVEVWGASYAWSDLAAMRRAAPEGEAWRYMGAFNHGEQEAICAPARFHYNGAAAPAGGGGWLVPRVELATVEAVAAGCCPVLNEVYALPWMDESNTVIVRIEEGKLVSAQPGSPPLREALRGALGRAEEMNAAFTNGLRRHYPMDDVRKLCELITEASE